MALQIQWFPHIISSGHVTMNIFYQNFSFTYVYGMYALETTLYVLPYVHKLQFL